jgi:predicted ATP-grasp superfamily ATP-dependent carboligase
VGVNGWAVHLGMKELVRGGADGLVLFEALVDEGDEVLRCGARQWLRSFARDGHREHRDVVARERTAAVGARARAHAC